MGVGPDPTIEASRVGVIGDIHTEASALRLALEHLEGLRLDAVVATGDLVDGPGDSRSVARCCQLLREHRVHTICGNHDRWVLDGEMRDLPDATLLTELNSDCQAFLEGLPPTIEIVTPMGSVLLCHGLGNDDMAGVQPFDRGYALKSNDALNALIGSQRHVAVVNGHTHRPMVRNIEGLTIINAGTLLADQQPCCVVCDFGARRVHFYELDPEGERFREGSVHEL